MQKIKILHIQETIGSGGVERRRLSLAKHLDKSVFEQLFVCTFEKGNIPDEIRNEGYSVISIGKLKSPFDWNQHKKIQKIIDEYKPDIIHGAVFEGVTMAAINGWIKKVPIILLEETSDPQNRSWKADFLMKLFSRLATKVIGVSEGVTEEYLKARLKLKSEKALSISNGVNIPRDVEKKEIQQIKMNLNILQDDFVIGSVGRMLDDSHKRFSDLIKAFSIFAKGKNNVKLLLVGEGPEIINYKQQANELEISDKIIFAGYQSDVSLYYKLMDVFALVSAREAFGLVLAEAMLSKLPVIATKIGGMKYIVDHDTTGFLVEPYNANQVADKLEELFNNSKLRNTMSENGYNKAMKQFTEEVYVDKVSNLYFSLINK